MGSCEQGGNHPVRVLLIGGPKHAEFIRLPIGQMEYGFVSMRTLMPSSGPTWSAFPASSEHVYRPDKRLTEIIFGPLNPSTVHEAVVFVHEVIADSPDHGGFNLHALRTAFRELEEAKEALEDAESLLSDRDVRLLNWQEKYEHLLEDHEFRGELLQEIRNSLEEAANDIQRAAKTTGRNYQPVSMLKS